MKELFNDISTTSIKYWLVTLVIFIVAFIFNRIVRFSLSKYFNSSSVQLNVNPTRYTFLKHSISFIIYLSALIAIFHVVPPLHSLGVTLFAGAGIFAAILGFASQQAFSNIISGIFIVIFKPFRVTDWVEVGTSFGGVVEDITLRHVIIRNFENKRIVIPNSIISSETITNWSLSDEKICNFIEISIGYEADHKKALRVLRETCEEHPSSIDNRSEEEVEDGTAWVNVRIQNFGDSSVNLRAMVWSKDAISGRIMKYELHERIKEAFSENGIEIPYPYRNLIIKDQRISN